MTQQEINKARNKKGIFVASNEAAGWYAISRDGINMITVNDTVRLYTLKGFARRVTQLLNRGY